MKVEAFMNGITRETFEQMDTDSKLNVLFDYIVSGRVKMEELNEKLDKKKRVDTTIAGISGMIGGIIAHLGQLTIFKH